MRLSWASSAPPPPAVPLTSHPPAQGEAPLLIEEAWNSPYITVFDPLDGALNIDVGIVTGTIFGIFKEKEECLVGAPLARLEMRPVCGGYLTSRHTKPLSHWSSRWISAKT